MTRKKIFRVFAISIAIALITSCSSMDTKEKITYMDDYLSIDCKMSDIIYDTENDKCYVNATIVIRNITSDKNIIINLDNLVLCAGADTSYRILQVSDPVTKLNVDEILYTGRKMTKSVYWIFNKRLSDEAGDSLNLVYRYNDPDLTRRLIW